MYPIKLLMVMLDMKEKMDLREFISMKEKLEN